MARKKIREYHGKRLLQQQIQRLRAKSVAINVARVTSQDAKEDNFFKVLLQQEPWLGTTKLVVKPDMLFGKRGKNNLVLLNADFEQAAEFIRDRSDMKLEVSGISGTITSFVIEPFIPHEEEYYFCIQATSTGENVSFGACGGMEIEENWDKVGTVEILALDEQADALAKIESLLRSKTEVSTEHQNVLVDFFKDCYVVYTNQDCTLLEMNPLTVVKEQAIPLDIRVELDTYAFFNHTADWKEIEFPEPWGQDKAEEESYIAAMDEKSGASLKLTVLNPNGRIWTMVAGGGASVIYADTVVDLGLGDELGNYAEYSGNPKQEETYLYARTLISLATKNPDGRNRALLIGGGVANFTDVAATFAGIIKAIKDFAGKIQEAKLKIFVRRGGPNYKTGLRLMEEVGKDFGLNIEVYGPDMNMTNIVKLGIDWISAN